MNIPFPRVPEPFSASGRSLFQDAQWSYLGTRKEFERLADEIDRLRFALSLHDKGAATPTDAFDLMRGDIGRVTLYRECDMTVGSPLRVVGLYLHDKRVSGGIELRDAQGPAMVRIHAGELRTHVNAFCFDAPVIGLQGTPTIRSGFEGLDCPTGLRLVNRGDNAVTVFFSAIGARQGSPSSVPSL